MSEPLHSYTQHNRRHTDGVPSIVHSGKHFLMSIRFIKECLRQCKTLPAEYQANCKVGFVAIMSAAQQLAHNTDSRRIRVSVEVTVDNDTSYNDTILMRTETCGQRRERDFFQSKNKTRSLNCLRDNLLFHGAFFQFNNR